MTIGRKIYSLRECPQAVLDWKIDANPQPLPLTPLLDSSNYTSNPLTPPPLPQLSCRHHPPLLPRPSGPPQIPSTLGEAQGRHRRFRFFRDRFGKDRRQERTVEA